MKLNAYIALALALCLGGPVRGQTARKESKRTSSAAPADRLGLTCTQVLQMTSAGWVKTIAAAKDATSASTIQAVAAYGKCYDARTSRLASALAKSGKGPLMGARGNFRDFEKALNDFTSQALAATDPPAGEQKKAYAALYEKQFRYEFYLAYEQKNFNPPPLTPEQSDAFTKLKNHFGELLGLLPEEKIHQLHAAFGQIFTAGGVPDATKVAVYRYAIFLLESPTETPYSLPPF
ncbi:MAG: hypothetical protein ACRD59_19410 [Candidatus Acidiferrales bacterium]